MGGAGLFGAGCIAFLLFGLLQTYAGAVGLADSFGTTWAGVGLVAIFVFRFSLPITVGAFLCAKNVWEWHWFLAVLFAAPGLVLAIPGVIGRLIERAKR